MANTPTEKAVGLTALAKFKEKIEEKIEAEGGNVTFATEQDILDMFPDPNSGSGGGSGT